MSAAARSDVSCARRRTLFVARKPQACATIARSIPAAAEKKADTKAPADKPAKKAKKSKGKATKKDAKK